jgi:hypothetical protein
VDGAFPGAQTSCLCIPNIRSVEERQEICRDYERFVRNWKMGDKSHTMPRLEALDSSPACARRASQ